MSVRAGNALQQASAQEEASMKRVLRVVLTPAEPRLGYKFVSKSRPGMGGCLACGAEFAKSAGVRRGKAELCSVPSTNLTFFSFDDFSAGRRETAARAESRPGFLSFTSFAASFRRL